MINSSLIQSELLFKAVRSSGAGGQNVNKVSTKVILIWDITASRALSTEQKEILSDKLKNRINKEGVFQLECDETRSQLKNKEIVKNRLLYLLEHALKKDKKRIATKIPKAVIKKRLNDKKIHSDKKTNRKFKW
ncbi:alternative ribosome rescue aminoacyl-tRNA hydrolase ArfB [Paenimyroides ceti]|uniref:alternative ribosome rescue aminoacyl-tRNA hydrolase ArfB n=1 Tax=Paenimyroides ceti TaxID=395087 RepID=UPI00294FF14C|nr:alternative ribosome rescue aminoacyl-tRNA hydrolase ArfB [Paenimyroides ceti]